LFPVGLFCSLGAESYLASPSTAAKRLGLSERASLPVAQKPHVMPGWSETPHGNPNVSHLYAALFGDLNLCTTIGQLCIRAFIVHSCSSISESNTIGDKATTIIIFPWALKHVRHPSVHIYPSLLTVVIRVVIIGLPF